VDVGGMKIDPKGFSREPSLCQAGESCMAGYESANETLRVSDDGEIVAHIETERAIIHGNRELIRIYEEKAGRRQ